MNVGSIMRQPVVTVRPETPLRDVARLLVEHGISGVPVVGDTDAVLGIVSEADFVIRGRGLPNRRPRLLDRLFGNGGSLGAEELAKIQARTAAQAMTSPAIVIGPATSVREAARIMSERAVNRLPVVSDDQLVGIVTRADVVRVFVRSDEELRTVILDDVFRRAMWLDERTMTVEVVDGVARISGNLEKRSDGPILARLVHDVPGVLDVELDVTWHLDDADIRRPEDDMAGRPAYGPR